MIDKEVSELRRRFRPEFSNITKIRGCYVNVHGELVSTFSESLGLLGEEEKEKYLDLLKKALSGSVGKTLRDVSFTTKQVMDSDEHRLLSRLRDSALSDTDAVTQLYETVAKTLHLSENYVILLAYDCYDVPFKSSDGASQADAGDTQYSYVICSICPVKETKPVLRYDSAEGVFRNRGTEWVATAPEVGFLFPAFDARATNLYGALYYSKSKDTSHEELFDAIFHVKPPMPLAVQKDTFREVLTEALQEECSPEVVQTVHSSVRTMMQLHKESKMAEPLQVSRAQVGDVLQECGISEEKMAAFNVKYDLAFGDDAALPPQNLIDAKSLGYVTPDVVVKVNPERADLVHTRTIGGVKYLLINIDEGVEINGINVHIEE